MNKFSNIAGYKTNTQKLVAFLYTNNELSKKEIKKTIPFTIASRRIKYSRNSRGITSTKEAKNLYTKNYKTLLK